MMFVKRVNAGITPITEANMYWQRIWLGERELRRFLAYSGLTAPPYNLRVEDFLRFGRKGITAGTLMKVLQKRGIAWSWNCDVIRRGVLQAIGYKLLDIEELEHNLVFAKDRR